MNHSNDNTSERSAGQATSVGWARVAAHWRDVALAFLLNVLLALPLAAAVRASIADSVRHRDAAQRLLDSWDGLWHMSFSAQAGGLDSTFDAGVVGIGAVFRALDALITGTLLDVPAPLFAIGLVYLIGWVLISGGLLGRYGGDERGLLRVIGAHAGRMVALAVVGWVAFSLVLGQLLPWLGGIVDEQTREVIDERVALAWTLGKYLIVWLLMLKIRVVIDYAKVFAVEHPERSVWAALGDSMALCRRRLGPVVGVLLRIGIVGFALLIAYWVVAPGTEQANPFKILIAFLISQVSVVARVVVRAWGLAAAQALASAR